MITSTNIPTEYMCASSAFQYSKMESEYLIKMDETEKSIVEKEEKEINEKFSSFKNQMFFLGTATGVLVGTVITGMVVRDAYKDNIKDLISRASDIGMSFIGPTGSGAGLGYLIGISGGIEANKFKANIMLKRADRLDKKIRDISKKMQIDGKILNDKEIAELEEAHTFFSHRLFDYKSIRSANSKGTHIMYQSNQISYQPNKV